MFRTVAAALARRSARHVVDATERRFSRFDALRRCRASDAFAASTRAGMCHDARALGPLPGDAEHAVSDVDKFLFDTNGFVVDFGKLRYLKEWIDENLDHACAISLRDPHLERMKNWEVDGLIQLFVIESASCEGIAQHLFEVFDPMVREHTNGRAWILSIELVEDSKNSATYAP